MAAGFPCLAISTWRVNGSAAVLSHRCLGFLVRVSAGGVGKGSGLAGWLAPWLAGVCQHNLLKCMEQGVGGHGTWKNDLKMQTPPNFLGFQCVLFQIPPFEELGDNLFFGLDLVKF